MRIEDYTILIFFEKTFTKDQEYNIVFSCLDNIYLSSYHECVTKKSYGFTLIELLVVIAVLGILAAGVLTAINPMKRIGQADDSRIKSDVGQIAQALQAYYTTNQSYPAAIADLITSGDLKTEPKTPAETSYTYGKEPTTCTTEAKNCQEVTVSAVLAQPTVSGAVLWCWRSLINKADETAAPPDNCNPL